MAVDTRNKRASVLNTIPSPQLFPDPDGAVSDEAERGQIVGYYFHFTGDVVAVAASDTLTLSDSASVVITHRPVAADTLTLEDSSAASLTIPVVAADTLTLSDTGVARLALNVLAADALDLADTASSVNDADIVPASFIVVDSARLSRSESFGRLSRSDSVASLRSGKTTGIIII